MHYDAESARERGFHGPVVDGQMFGALIARQIRAWAGNRARFVALEFRNRGVVTAPSTVTVISRVAAREPIDDGGERIEILSEVVDDAGRRVVEQGRTTIELPQ
jgi:acyl dehydratase